MADICYLCYMRRIIVFILLALFCSPSFAQFIKGIECDWNPCDSLERYWVRHDGGPVPDIWNRYPNANHIFGLRHGWRISYNDEVILPEYIVFKYDDIRRTPSIYDATRLAYNYFSKYPQRSEYVMRDCIVTVRRIKKE